VTLLKGPIAAASSLNARPVSTYNAPLFPRSIAWRASAKVTGKKPQVGHHVSHANNKTIRRFYPNLQYRRFWVESEKRWVRLRTSNAGVRIIDKKGIDAVLKELRERGEI